MKLFRCISKLKGLVIDVDSFVDNHNAWSELFENYQCVFITSDESTKNTLISIYGEKSVLFVDDFLKFFLPNWKTQIMIMNMLDLKATEFAYISTSNIFMNNAMAFLSSTIWVSQDISYSNISISPDLICSSINEIYTYLSNNIYGFYGEAVIDPENSGSGNIIPIKMDIENTSISLVVLGRYFSYSHYMNQLHPYSSAIFLNKQEGKKYYGVFTDELSNIYSNAVKTLSSIKNVDAVLNVPVRLGKANRFKAIVDKIAKDNHILDISNQFVCIGDYPSQKNLSTQERQLNVKGKFEFNGDLNGKNVVLIDDVISTGSTIKECVETLTKNGANKVYVVVLAVNQRSGSYWKSAEPIVNCPKCNDKMHLLVNSKTGDFFYSCYSCSKTLSYHDGKKRLINNVNTETQL